MDLSASSTEKYSPRFLRRDGKRNSLTPERKKFRKHKRAAEAQDKKASRDAHPLSSPIFRARARAPISGPRALI